MEKWTWPVIVLVLVLIVGGAVFALYNDSGTFAGTLQQVTDNGSRTSKLTYFEGGAQVTGVFVVNGSPLVVGDLAVTGTVAASSVLYLEDIYRMEEVASPGSPQADEAYFFLRDNGAGKSQFCVNFSSGTTQVLATQP